MVQYLHINDLREYEIPNGEKVNLVSLVANLKDLGSDIRTVAPESLADVKIGQVVYGVAIGQMRRGVVVKIGRTKVHMAFTTQGAIDEALRYRNGDKVRVGVQAIPLAHIRTAIVKGKNTVANVSEGAAGTSERAAAYAKVRELDPKWGVNGFGVGYEIRVPGVGRGVVASWNGVTGVAEIEGGHTYNITPHTSAEITVTGVNMDLVQTHIHLLEQAVVATPEDAQRKLAETPDRALPADEAGEIGSPLPGVATYRVTMERIGRDRNVQPFDITVPADMAEQAEDFLASAIHDKAEDFLVARWFSVKVDIVRAYVGIEGGRFGEGTIRRV